LAAADCRRYTRVVDDDGCRYVETTVRDENERIEAGPSCYPSTHTCNNQPVANDDPGDAADPAYIPYTSAVDTSLSVLVPGVLWNDTDPDPDTITLTADLVSGPTCGTLVGGLGMDGSFQFDPVSCSQGVYTIDYIAHDG
jgi:hypothetical protein